MCPMYIEYRRIGGWQVWINGCVLASRDTREELVNHIRETIGVSLEEYSKLQNTYISEMYWRAVS
jgi:hypothetical protein